MTPTAPRRTSTLRRRLVVMLVTSGLVLGVLVAGAAVVLARLVDRQEAVTRTYFDAITDADSAFVHLVDAETAVRGFALTGDEVTLEPYERALAEVSFATLAARQREGGDEQLAQAAAGAARAAQVWYDDFAEPVVGAVRAGGPAAVSASTVEAGRTLFDDARAEAQVYTDLLRERRHRAATELRTWMSVAMWTLVALVGAAVALGVGLWVALRRWVVEPLHALAADARAVSSGDLRHPVVGTGPGEITSLARDVETMRTTLVAQVEEVERSRAEIQDAHARLSEQTEELERSNRDLEQFAYVASHDLQEPLRKVASFTQLLQKRYGGQLDERADQYIEFAVDGAKRMQRLIQDLLGFSRVGRVTGELTDVDLADVLAQALDNLGEAVVESGATVTHDALPVVRGERTLLVQLLQNLVGNAIKFRDPDRPPVVHLSAEREGDEWVLRCRDNGIGIDEQYADRVFVIFQRLHAKDVYEGTGIGLALCKKIVEFHGGRIWIDPPDGDGSSIRWTLPATDPQAPSGQIGASRA